MHTRLIYVCKIQILLFLIVSCNCNSNKQTKTVKEGEKQSFDKIIPKGKSGRVSYEYILQQRLTKQAGLKIIENGVDSLNVRIWYVYNLGFFQLADFKYEYKNWTGTFYTIQDDVDEHSNEIKVKTVKSEIRLPNSGWNSFISKIDSLGIFSLPDESELQDYYNAGVPSDAEFVFVEISTVTNYRIYGYSIPTLFPEIKEAKAIEDIMQLIEDEFGVKRVVKF